MIRASTRKRKIHCRSSHEHPAHNKSAGLTVAKQQMVEIAKAISYHSRILIMDEPTAALTNDEIDDLFRVVERLKNRI